MNRLLGIFKLLNIIFFIFTVPLLAAVRKKMPATTIAIEEPSSTDHEHISKWYFSGGLNSTARFDGLYGFSVASGRSFDVLNLEMYLAHYKVSGRAAQVHHRGITAAEQPVGHEAFVDRMSIDGAMWSVGVGANLTHKLIRDDHWTELMGFNLGYITYNESPRSASFNGGHLKVFGGIGYRFESLTLTSVLAWNQVFARRVNSDLAYQSYGYLPMQWASIELGLLFYAF